MGRFSALLSNVSPKLYAAAAGAGAGAAVQEFALWLLGVQVWGAPFDAGNAQAAIDSVPGPVAKGVAVAVILLGVVIGAYAAPSNGQSSATVDASDIHDPEPRDVQLVDDSDAPNVAQTVL